MSGIRIEVLTHYEQQDIDFDWDYCSIDLKVVRDGMIIFEKSYGDFYHDKSREKVEAIIEFIQTVFDDDIVIVRKQVADF